MMLERTEASSAPPVSSSAFNASSGGQSALLSCDKRPRVISSLLLSSARDRAPSPFKYASRFIANGLDHLNPETQAKSLDWRNDFNGGGNYYGRMAAPGHDWFLKEWLKATGKKQADLVKDLDWNKAKASLMFNGKQPYTKAEVNELSAYLNILPHELLMHPEEAFAFRRLKADLIRLAHETEEPESDPPAKKVSSN